MNSNIPISIMRISANNDLPLPSYESAGAAGMDLRAAVKSAIRLEPGQIALVSSGFAIALPAGYEAQVRPRSGLATKHGITIVNSPGTIDSDYRGEIKIALINLGTEAFEISPGLRIAQLVIAPVSRIEWKETHNLPPTSRGIDGFGHTGS